MDVFVFTHELLKRSTQWESGMKDKEAANLRVVCKTTYYCKHGDWWFL
jgi:hypothetical protein